MSKGFTSYRIRDQNGLHHLTFATVNWLDVFMGIKYRDVLIDSLAYCRKEKGVELLSTLVSEARNLSFESGINLKIAIRVIIQN